MDPHVMEQRNLDMQKKYATIRETEVRYEEYLCDDADYLLVAFGCVARMGKEAVDTLRREGIKAGLFRPITLWPFPEKQLHHLAGRLKGILVPEMNVGQMIYDVRLAVEGQTPIKHFGRIGGVVPTPDEIILSLKQQFIP